MWSAYTLQLSSPAGVLVEPLDEYASIQMVRSVNAVGTLTLTIPWESNWRLWDRLTTDSVIDVMRRGNVGGTRRLMDTVWFVRKRELAVDQNGELMITVECLDTQDLLRRWLVLADSGTAYADKPVSGVTGVAAETAMKAYVTEQIVSGTGRAAGTNLAGVFSVEPDAGAGELVFASASYQTVLTALQTICQDSTQKGTYMAFDVVATAVGAYQFRTYVDQRGADRTAGSPLPVVFSGESGSFIPATYTEDLTSCPSMVRCAGQTGAYGTMQIADAIDGTLESLGPVAHVEEYVSAQQTSLYGAVETQAYRALRANRPVIEMPFTVAQSPTCEVGVHFNLGDRVTVRWGHILMDARLETITISVDPSNGTETVTTTAKSTADSV